jgi:uncharacterized protein (DUF1800 family)
MTIMAYQALIRFGMGRLGRTSLPDDPRQWLAAQIHGPDQAAFPPQLPSTADGLTVWREKLKLKLSPELDFVRPLLREDMRAQLNQALGTDAAFRERLVWFWANHFTVSIKAGAVSAVAGPYVREAIRPNVTSPFLDMLLAVMRHPAMLIYLDNTSSVGPASQVGQRLHRGLNENLARECLELHTLGVDGGYTQQDVTELAKLLTGWSVDFRAAEPGFVFRPEAHEPGPKVLLGRRFVPGEAGGLMALEFLAGHPATHRHLARKLVRHFVADDPPPDAVRTVEGVLRDSGGDLAAASLALIDLPGAWEPLAKIRGPADFVLAALRALDLPEAQRPPPENAMVLLGQPMWSAPLPNGFPDDAASWAAPEAVMRRIDWAYNLAGRAAGAEPDAVADEALGPLLRGTTRAAMAAAGARRDALTLLLTAEEFQRR